MRNHIKAAYARALLFIIRPALVEKDRLFAEERAASWAAVEAKMADDRREFANCTIAAIGKSIRDK